MIRETPNPIDIHVGKRLKQRRIALGVSQEKLAEALTVTFQQIQKYEKGINRMGASRLYQLSRILDVSINFFFAEYETEYEYNLQESNKSEYGKDPSPVFFKELIVAVSKIKSEKTRQKILELIQSLTLDP